MSTILLLHFDGDDGSTTFTEQTGSTVTAYGNAQVDTAVKRFDGSLMLDGAGDYVSVSHRAVHNLGGGDFTLEFFACLSSGWFTDGTGRAIISKASSTFSDAGNIFLVTTPAHDIELWVTDYSTSSPLLTTNGQVVLTSSANHVAVSRAGSAWRIYVNGNMVYSNTWAGSISSNSQAWLIGKDPTGTRSDLNRWIDELRLSDVALYTNGSSITVPTAPFPNPSFTGAPTGFTSTAFGTPERDARMIPYWLQSTTFGHPSVRHNQFGNSVGITGAATFGQPSVEQVFVPRTTNAWAGGFNSTVFGQPTRKLDHLAFGISDTRFGTPAFGEQRAGVATSIGLDTIFGTPRGNTSAQFHPAAISVATDFGVPRCSYHQQGAPLWSWSSAFGTPSRKTEVIESIAFSVKTRAESVTVLGR